MAGKGILINVQNDLQIKNKNLIIGNTLLQETALILIMNQGEHKFEPILGPNLIQLKKTKYSSFDIEKRTKIHLALDGKDYQVLKHLIKTKVK